MEYPLELFLKSRVTSATGSLGIPDSRGPGRSEGKMDGCNWNVREH